MRAFISYRRDDSVDIAGRLHDGLVARFGQGSIVMDVDSIPVGADFTSVIQQEIERCDVVLAVIGPRWLDSAGPDGQRRLDGPSDFVRIEIESALSINIPVVPVLVGGVEMPRDYELPASIAELSYRNATIIRSGPDFHYDLDRFIRALEDIGDRLPPKGPVPPEHPVPDLNPREVNSNLVFVSHSTLDREWVEREVVSFLESNSIPTWYAKSSIMTSAQWEREILEGMQKCDWFLLVVSPRAADSDWVKDELFWAIDNRPTRIVPVIMEICDPYLFHIRLKRIQHVDFTSEIQAAKSLLIEHLNSGGG